MASIWPPCGDVTGCRITDVCSQRMSYPTPNQGQTSGDPSEIECPSCGRGNDITGDPEKEGDVHDCAHCDESFEITGVDYRVTVTVKALPKKDAICGRCGDR